MSHVVIHCEGLGKSYYIGHEGRREKYSTLRDSIARHARQVWESSRRAWRGQAVVAGQEIEEFWALRDVSFEVREGEVVGIIGRNGAGKSTLLKILSRITEPTEGRVTLRGRVASLLEVGTGFHPELTGRENIFLNGAILGMTRSEIKRKFDEIVAFADGEKFLDTPVKRYSSGMQVRLAFAVAAHLEPEILVVDEVLAVGDAEFQKKCLGKMQDVAVGGRTVLFVSHNMSAVSVLCQTGILLTNGQVSYIGSVEDAISTYNAHTVHHLSGSYSANGQSRHPHFTRVEVFQDDVNGTLFRMDRPIGIRLEFDRVHERNAAVGIRIRNSQGVTVIHSTDELMPSEHPREYLTRHCTLPPYALAEGTYFVRAGLFAPGRQVFQVVDDMVSFEVSGDCDLNGKVISSKWQAVTGPGLAKWTAHNGQPVSGQFAQSGAGSAKMDGVHLDESLFRAN